MRLCHALLGFLLEFRVRVNLYLQHAHQSTLQMASNGTAHRPKAFSKGTHQNTTL